MITHYEKYKEYQERYRAEFRNKNLTNGKASLETDKILKPCPICGRRLHVKLEKYAYGEGYLVRCAGCFVVTEIAEDKEKASDHWNNGKYSETCKRLMKPHEFNQDGIVKLTEKVFEQATEHYISVLKFYKRHMDSEDAKRKVKDAERFYRNNPLMKGLSVDADEVIGRIRKRVLG